MSRSNAELEQFAYVASHDLQEPLRMVASYTQLLGRRYRGQLDQDADEFIGYAVDGATRTQALINALLKYARVGSQAKTPQPTDTGALFDQIIADYHLTLEELAASVTRGHLPTVVGDPLQVRQLFQNLIGNALKYRGADPPRVHVAAERICVIFQRLHS